MAAYGRTAGEIGDAFVLVWRMGKTLRQYFGISKFL